MRATRLNYPRKVGGESSGAEVAQIDEERRVIRQRRGARRARIRATPLVSRRRPAVA